MKARTSVMANKSASLVNKGSSWWDITELLVTKVHGATTFHNVKVIVCSGRFSRELDLMLLVSLHPSHLLKYSKRLA